MEHTRFVGLDIHKERISVAGVTSFINEGALSRGAAIAFYAVTSIGPVLLIVVAIAGLAFGQDAARGAIVSQLSGLMGQQSAELLQNVIRGASGKSSGVFASALGVITLLVTASGVFGEMQSALNAIWKADPKGGTVSRLLRAAPPAWVSWRRLGSCFWSRW